MTDLLVILFLLLMVAFGGAVAYLVYRALAVVAALASRVTRLPLRGLAGVGFAVGGTGVVLLLRAWATAASCESEAMDPFLAATVLLPVALAIGRYLRFPAGSPPEPRTGWAVQAVAGLGVVAWPAVVFAGLASRTPARDRATTLADLRTIASAEEAYATENGGFYDRLECLQRPADCLPGYTPSRPTFLDPALVSTKHRGYVRTFVPGDPAPPERARAGGISASSLTTWALVAVPAPPVRGRCDSFCADSSGRICRRPDGREPALAEGLCGPGCEDLP